MNSYTSTQTFTATHAKYMASKVAADLKRMQRFYNYPSDSSITEFETEVIELLKKGYLGTITYGFQKDGKWIAPTLRYTARDLSGMSANDDDPGRVPIGADVANASFYSYLTYSSAWSKLTDAERTAFKEALPFQRGGATEPGVNGYFSSDKSYSSGSKALDRSTLKN